MAHAKVQTTRQITLELDEGEARTLKRVLNSHVIGDGVHRVRLNSIDAALNEVAVAPVGGLFTGVVEVGKPRLT